MVDFLSQMIGTHALAISSSGEARSEYRTERSVVGTYNFGLDWVEHGLLDLAPCYICGGNGLCDE